MSLDPNQFSQIPVQGQVDLSGGNNGSIYSGQLGAAQTDLIPGQALKRVDDYSKPPSFIAAAADEEDIAGFIVYDIKSQNFDTGDLCEVMNKGVMYMTAGAAIAANANVMIVVSGSKVVTATSTNRIIGKALDKASADGDLIRVMVELPGALA